MSGGQEGDAQPRLGTWSVVRQMGRYFRPYRRQVAGSLALILVQCGTALASPLLLRRIVDEAIPHHDVGLLTALCGLMVGMGLAGSTVAVGESALKNWIGQRVVADLRVAVYDRARAQPLAFYTTAGEAQIQARLVSDIEGVDRLLTNTAQSVLAAVTSLAVAVAVMLILSWPLALLSLAIATGLSLVNNRFSARRRALASQRQGHLTTLMAHVAEDLSLAGIILGRTLVRTDRQRARFTGVSDQVRDVTVRQRITGALALTVIGATYACVPPVIYFLAGSVVPGLTLGTAVVLVMLQGRLSGPIQSLLLLSGGIQASVARFERVLEYLTLPVTPTGAAALAPAGDLRLRGVGYRYPHSPGSVLAGVDLDLPAGSVTVVVGASGSGKSTLALVLAGLVEPTAGTVAMPGPAPADAATLRAAVTLVPQHTLLLRGTIGDNLRFAADDFTPARLSRALRTVQLGEVVDRLPLGLDTPVGEGGYQLSGGERQRLALARALLAPGRVLVLDEATSALDNITAERLYAALRAGCPDRTLVVVAHRIPRLEPDDRIVVVSGGRIVESGPHAELVARHGAYTRLLHAQTQPAPSAIR